MYHFSFNKRHHYKKFSFQGKAFLLLVFILFSILGYTQKPVGVIRYYNTIQSHDNFYTLLYFNVNQTKYIGWDEKNLTEDYRRSDYTITRDYSKHTLHDIVEVSGKPYIIEDSLRPPRWIILNQMKEIAGHICMNAFYEDTLKKQKVVGWFAMDMIMGGGPERYFGLPGMILEIDINDGAKIITAEKIELKPLTNELNFPKKAKGKKIKEKDYIEIQIKQFAKNKKEETLTGRY